ncbi:hypothetical protein AVEN_121614-1 [Araneus ventricosus]|uniref:Uncharacterized protein n=1 Tax=Araneus ventricosus TaxID=182803 RepID=A0A4Y2N5U9_ARAVE|nr:hypothetical protein AVEN_121614-1 [Araneus ventricosus]
MDSSAPFPLFSSLRVVGDMNDRPFISYFSLKGPFNDHSPNCLLPPFGTATGRNVLHQYRSCMAGYGRLRSQSVKIISLQEERECRILRCENVFTIKNCMQEDRSCMSLFINDKEVPVYVGKKAR